MLRTLLLILFAFGFSRAALARVELQTSQGTNDAGTQTFVQVTTYYDDQGTEKRDKPLCLLIKDGAILNAGNAKNCLTSSKHDKAKPFKTALLNRDGKTVTDPVIEEKQVIFPKHAAGKYDAEKVFAHLDDKGNLVLVEQSAAVPLDANKNATGGVITSTIIVTQPVDPQYAKNGTLPLFTTRGNPPVDRGGPNELKDLEKSLAATNPSINSVVIENKAPEALPVPPVDENTTAPASSEIIVERNLPVYKPPLTAKIEVMSSDSPSCVNDPKDPDYCSSLHNDGCVLHDQKLLASACDPDKCDSVTSCISAYDKLRSNKEFKTTMRDIAQAEKEINIAKKNIKKADSQSLKADTDDLTYWRILLKKSENQLNAMVSAQRLGGKNDCLPSRATNSFTNFRKVTEIQKTLAKCNESASQNPEPRQTTPTDESALQKQLGGARP